MTRRLILDQGLFDAMAARLAEPNAKYATGGPIGYSIDPTFDHEGLIERVDWCCLTCSATGSAPTAFGAHTAAGIHRDVAHAGVTA